MVAIRCTQKLLRRLDAAPGGGSSESTTILGDWYANILHSRPNHLVLCVNARTLLPVILPAREFSTLAQRIRDALASVLMAIQVPEETIEAELREMEHVTYGPTQNRHLMGTVNQFMYHLKVLAHERAYSSLTEMALHIAGIPCAPLGYKFPREVTVELLCADREHRPQLH